MLEAFEFDACLRYISVIAVTADGMLRNNKRGRSAGLSDCMTKLIDIRAFPTVVNWILKSPTAS